MTDIDKNPELTKLIEKLYQAQQDKKAAEALGKLINLYKTKPSFSASTPRARLSELGDLAAWRAVDTEIPRRTREKYLQVARTIDILLTGKTQRPASLPKMRRAMVGRL